MIRGPFGLIPGLLVLALIGEGCDYNNITAVSPSSGGTRIAFSSERIDVVNDIYVMDEDGGNPVNLTSSPGLGRQPLVVAGP